MGKVPEFSGLRDLSLKLSDALSDYDNADGGSRPMHTIYVIAAAREFLHYYSLLADFTDLLVRADDWLSSPTDDDDDLNNVGLIADLAAAVRRLNA